MVSSTFQRTEIPRGWHHCHPLRTTVVRWSALKNAGPQLVEHPAILTRPPDCGLPILWGDLSLCVRSSLFLEMPRDAQLWLKVATVFDGWAHQCRKCGSARLLTSMEHEALFNMCKAETVASSESWTWDQAEWEVHKQGNSIHAVPEWHLSV